MKELEIREPGGSVPEGLADALQVPGPALDVIHDKIDEALAGLAGIGPREGSARRLGGVTNQVFHVRAGGQEIALRLPGRGAAQVLDRQAELHNHTAATSYGLTPALQAYNLDSGVCASAYLAAPALRPADLQDPDLLAAACAALRGLHSAPISFRPAFLPKRAPEHLGPLVPGPMPPLLSATAEAHRRCVASLDTLDAPAVPCHQDLYAMNMLLVAGAVTLIDWEHSGPGDPLYDLADLAVQADLRSPTPLLALYLERAPTSQECRRFALNLCLSELSWGMWGLTRARLETVSPAYVQRARGLARRGAEDLVPVLDEKGK